MSRHRSGTMIAIQGWAPPELLAGVDQNASMRHNVGRQRPVTVVAGGGRGIGAATTVYLARAGHDLALSYLSDAGAAEQVADAARAAGARVIVVAGDVSDPAVADRVFDVASDLGVVTGLVNNAGLTGHIGDLADTPVDVITRVVQVNLLGAI